MRGHKENTGRSLASKLKHQFVYALIFLGGRWLAYLFLYVLVFFYSITPSVFNKSRAYVSRRFKPQNTWQFFRHTYLLNLTFARTLVDRAALGILGHTQVITTQQEIDQCLALLGEGKGLILLSAHAGCWQMAVNLMNFLPGKKHVLYYRNPKDNDKTVAEHTGRPAPFEFINPAGPLGGVVEMISALQRGEILCAMGDRVFGEEKNAVGVNFLGGKIRVPYSFYRLSAATGTPILVMLFPWEGRGRFSSRTAGVLRVEDKGPLKANYQPQAQQFVDALEEFCIKYPYQFFNYFDLWETTPYATNHRRN